MEKQYCNVARYKNTLYVRELLDGKENYRKEKIKPYLFQRTSNKSQYQDYKRRYYLVKKEFESSYKMKEYIDTYGSMPNELWGTTDVVTQFIYKEKYNSKDTSKIVTSFIDIEVCTRSKSSTGEWIDGGFPNADEALFPINAICDYRTNDKKYHLFTTAQGWTKEKSQLKYSDDVVYTYCNNETELLHKWISYWKANYPHIVSGWNNKVFDIPYIVNRMNVLGMNPTVLSPWGIVEPKTKNDNFGNELHLYDICGIATIDYLDLYKKYRLVPRERYTLDYISRCENPHEHKLEFHGTHGELYYNDPVFFCDYNIQDVRCLVCFERDLGFMSLIVYLSYYAGVNFENNFSPIMIWETLISNTMEDNFLVTPLNGPSAKKERYEGAYVHEPKPGLKGCIASFDFSSLYPNTMILFYIGADVHVTDERYVKLKNEFMDILRTHDDTKEMLNEIEMTGIFNDFYINNDIPACVTDFLKREKVSLTTNVEFYDVSKKSIIVSLIEQLFKERKADKKTSFDYKFKAQEIKEELTRRGIKVESDE